MACPFFLPASSLAGFTDLYSGDCAQAAGLSINREMLRTCCNNGYAREVCAHAAASDADAFRFFIRARREGAVDVSWSSERNHHPVAVGNLSVAPDATAATPLERQAHAFAAAYLRQMGGGN
ncbi:MAG: hypothetical protein M3N93_00670 [Acidobacteriota bacterium]|nr:hypothetical protein [Acidobacteriota bacterium]